MDGDEGYKINKGVEGEVGLWLVTKRKEGTEKEKGHGHRNTRPLWEKNLLHFFNSLAIKGIWFLRFEAGRNTTTTHGNRPNRTMYEGGPRG